MAAVLCEHSHLHAYNRFSLSEIINELSSAKAACPRMYLTRFSNCTTCLGSEVYVLPRLEAKIDNIAVEFATMGAVGLNISWGITIINTWIAYQTDFFSYRGLEGPLRAPHMVPSIYSPLGRGECSPGFRLCNPSTEGFRSLRAPFCG